MPVAENVTVWPLGVDGATGLMLIFVSTAEVTVRLAEGAIMLLTDAVIQVLPITTPVAIPVALLILAIAVFADDHDTWLVMSAVLASL